MSPTSPTAGSPADAETAFAHVAVCDRCRVALDAQRAVSRARGAAAPPPSDAFMARLLGIPAPAASRPRPGAPAAGRARAARPASGRPWSAPANRPAARRRRVRVAVGSAAGAAALAVVAVVGGAPAAIGGSCAPTVAVAPVVDALADEHSASTQRMPFSGPRDHRGVRQRVRLVRPSVSGVR